MKEDWENIWYVGMFGSMLAAAVLLYYKPDTRCVWLPHAIPHLTRHPSIQTWALKEAKERMEAREEKYKYEPPSS